MPKTKALAVRADAQLAFPGVTITENSLTVTRDLTPDETRTVIGTLKRIDSSAHFWIGDFISHIAAKHSEGSENDEARDKATELAAHEVAGQFDNPMAVLEAYRVTRHFGAKRFALSFQHHREALAECGCNVEAAARFLAEAEKNSWSPKELRHAIRHDGVPESHHRGKGTPTLTSALAKLNRHLVVMFRDVPIESIDKETLAEIASEFAPVEEVLGKIHAALKSE